MKGAVSQITQPPSYFNLVFAHRCRVATCHLHHIASVLGLLVAKDYLWSMKLTILAVGKTTTPYLKSGIDDYIKRAARYMPVQMEVVADVKNASAMPSKQRKEREGRAILERLQPGDRLVLLDERGRQLTSTAFARAIETNANNGIRRMVLVIGGPFGFSAEVYARADAQISLSAMTFTHEMVRLFLAEQVYRAMTIIRGENYHHD